MKIIESWLKEWVNVPLASNQLASQLTTAGIEVEDEKRLAPTFSGVVVGEVISADQHPNADKLHLCLVNVGNANPDHQPLSIVCGASNVRTGLKVAVAMVGAALPGGLAIKKAKLRGIESFGMLCSSKELAIEALGFSANGILELPSDAPVGTDLQQYLHLEDTVLHLALTPNRGDCASVLGIAREIAAINDLPLSKNVTFDSDAEKQFVVPSKTYKVEVDADAQKDCPSYAYCILENLDSKVQTPQWMRQRLELSGIHSSGNTIVDITNYVMLELGQPLHAFDLRSINNNHISVRHAAKGEQFVALDGQTRTLDEKDLVISTADILIANGISECKNDRPEQFDFPARRARSRAAECTEKYMSSEASAQQSWESKCEGDKKVLALAGIIGSSSSGVNDDTSSILLESAHFAPECISQTSRKFNLVTEASYRFERGVDPTLPQAALAYARKLLLDICKGNASRIAHISAAEFLTSPSVITLHAAACEKLLGSKISPPEMLAILQRLGTSAKQSSKEQGVWQIQVPTFRFDLGIEADLIEEIARLYGYNKLQSSPPKVEWQAKTALEDNSLSSIAAAKKLLIARGFREVITYSFGAPLMQEALGFNKESSLQLVNPLSEEMSRMRPSLVPGLLEVLQYNLRRQQSRIRIFESGLCFKREKESISSDKAQGAAISQIDMLAGLVAGDCFPLQWGEPKSAVDFYDIKNDVEALLLLCGCSLECIEFKASPKCEGYMHPKQSAEIYIDGALAGFVGALHPRVQQKLELASLPIFVFELEWQKISSKMPKMLKGISKFPVIERDIALVMNEQILWGDVAAKICSVSGDILRAVTLFDVYKDSSIGVGKKSFALRLRLQHDQRTLLDEEVDALIAKIIKMAETDFGAAIRK